MYTIKSKTISYSLASLFSTLTALGAYISIPISHVPITLQTFFVYLAGAILGSKLALLSQIIYILIGIIGFPVFAYGKAGFGVLIGPTGGYLIGFIIGAYIIGRMIEMKKNFSFKWTLLSTLIGTAIIYCLGIIQLSYWLGGNILSALIIGIFPFLPGDLLKALLSSYIAMKIHRIIKIK
jgi:biotin transport system substrate-specific component